MKIIDGDALIKSIETWTYNGTFDKSYLLDIIKRAKEVDINKLIFIESMNSDKRKMMLNALRTHGEWIQREEIFDDEETPRLVWGCKDCGFSLKSIHDKRNYCPNCGAKMKGGTQ